MTLAVIVGAPYAHEPAHADTAEADLIEILRKARTVAILRESVKPLQDFEDAIWNLMARLTSIDGADGVHLDRIGGWLDILRRDGWSDATFRRRIRARILQLRSRGRTEDLISITLLLLNLTGTGYVELREHGGPACQDLYLHSIPTSDDVEDMRVILGSAKAGGVSLQLLVAQDVADLDDVLVAGDEGGAVAGGVAGDEGGAVAGEGLFAAVMTAP